MPTLDEYMQSHSGLDLRIAESPGAGSGRAFFHDLIALPPLSRKREDAVLAAVKGGQARVLWGTVSSKWNGHAATLFVMRDALALGGEDDYVRVSVRCDTAQMIADFLSAQLLTPNVADLIFDQADARIAPQPQGAWVKDSTMSKTRRMLDYQDIVQRGLDAAKAQPTGLLANMGKHWVVTNRLWETGAVGKAANYGWHLGPTAAGPLDQRVEIGHGFDLWVDYSQLVQLMGSIMIVNGQPARTADVMMDPALYGLVSSDFIRTLINGNPTKKAEGVLRGFRYPSGNLLA